jgi:hypothetical protein
VFADFVKPFVGHGGDDRVLVIEIMIEMAGAYLRLSTNVGDGGAIQPASTDAARHRLQNLTTFLCMFGRIKFAHSSVKERSTTMYPFAALVHSDISR